VEFKACKQPAAAWELQGEISVRAQHPLHKAHCYSMTSLLRFSSDTYLSFIPMLHGDVFNASDLVAYEHVLLNRNFLPIGIASGGRKAKVVFKNPTHCR